jgi:membrane protease subunit HflK
VESEALSFWEAFFASDAWLLIGVGFVMGTFDRIMDWLENLIGYFQFLTVVDQYDMGVVLRFGKYHRTLGPGLHLVIPFGIEEVTFDTVVRTTSYLDVQSVTSSDGKPVNINAVLVYKIGNIKRWLLEVDDAEDALHDMTYGIISELAETRTWAQIMKPAFMDEVTEQVQEEAISWGARVEAVKLSDRVTSRSIRLLGVD